MSLLSPLLPEHAGADSGSRTVRLARAMYDEVRRLQALADRHRPDADPLSCALRSWTHRFGTLPVTPRLSEAYAALLAATGPADVLCWQHTLARMFAAATRPYARARRRHTWLQSTRDLCAQESVLVLLDACARRTGQTSVVPWPSPSAFARWTRRIEGRRPSTGVPMYRNYLAYLNLQDCRLAHLDLSHANLRGANLEGAHLAGARLDEADLSQAHLTDADLKGASLRRARLDEAMIIGTRLEGAVLDGARLVGAVLIGANLRQASLRDASLVDAHLDSADFSTADLARADLANVVLVEADLRGANLRGARLAGVRFTRANIDRAILLCPFGGSIARPGTHPPRDAGSLVATAERAYLQGQALREVHRQVVRLKAAELDHETYLDDSIRALLQPGDPD